MAGWDANLARHLARLHGTLCASLTFLTRLPLQRLCPGDTRPLSESMAAFPLAGAIIGAVSMIPFLLLASLSAPPLLCGLTAVTCSIILTGALHEDGLADTADGFWGGGEKDRRLEIMRDSRIGSFGVLALNVSVMSRTAALAAISGAPLVTSTFAIIASGAISRLLPVWLLTDLAPARNNGVGSGAGRPAASTAVRATTNALLLLIPLAIFGGLAACTIAAVLAAASYLIVRALAVRHIGGHTGDVAGAVQQVGEITFLSALAISL